MAVSEVSLTLRSALTLLSTSTKVVEISVNYKEQSFSGLPSGTQSDYTIKYCKIDQTPMNSQLASSIFWFHLFLSVGLQIRILLLFDEPFTFECTFQS